VRLKHVLTVALLGCLVVLGCPASTQRIHLTERSPLSDPGEFAARRQIRLSPADRGLLEYALASESFELYLPTSHTHRSVRSGLVWVSPGESGAPPRAWAAVLDRLGVVWIGANASGNRRSPPDRSNLALDAAAYLETRLGASEARIFVGGFSGGARIASELALLYPDVFAGGLFIGAVDYFRLVRSSDPRWPAWKATFPSPPAHLLQQARSSGRYVLVVGSQDSNRSLVQDVHRAYVTDGISGARLLEVADLGHELPPSESFEQALVELLSRK